MIQSQDPRTRHNGTSLTRGHQRARAWWRTHSKRREKE
jgi:hypothetical protein